jgi:hypothetical protein
VIQEGLQISKKLRDSIYLEEKEKEKGTVSLVDLSMFDLVLERFVRNLDKICKIVQR